jgi:hypothetical protein
MQPARSHALSFLLAATLLACGGVVDDSDPLPSPSALSSGNAGAPGDGGASGEGGETSAPVVPSAPAPAGTTSPGAPPTGGNAAPPAVTAPPAACSEPEEGERVFPTEQKFAEALVGRWMLCGTVSVFGTQEAGLEFAADGRWYKLYLEPDGGVVRGKGFDREGGWSTIDTSAFNGKNTYQLNLDIDGSGSIYTLPRFAEGPRKVRMSNIGVFEGNYAIDP